MEDKKVCVIGIWHLGSVTAGCLADMGYNVAGFDRDMGRVQRLSQGTPPLFEPGLEDLLTKNIRAKRLGFTSELGQAVTGADYVIIAFDTPVDDNDEADLTEILAAAEDVAAYLKSGATVIVCSQVPVGTCERIKDIIQGKAPELGFGIACSPENLRLGQAISVFNNPERIVAGAEDEATLDKVEQLFQPIAAPVIRMNLRTAEMTKHALNAFLATSVSFANEIANICDEVGADAVKVAEALKADTRIGKKARLMPGLGFAGGTLARDLKALQKIGKAHDYATYMVDAVLKVNKEQNRMAVKKLNKVYGSVKGLSIGVLGLTYKAGTSTLRRSAALEIISDLVSEGAVVRAHDPKADLAEIQQHGEFEFCPDPYAAADNADALIIITEWPEFADLDYALIKARMKKPVVIDVNNMLKDRQLTEKGLIYMGIGRGLDETKR